MSLTDLALGHRRLTLAAVVVLAAWGAALLPGFPSRSDPAITVRQAVVTALHPGMPPARIEQLVTRKLEERIRLIAGVDNLWSTSRHGITRIHVEAHDRVEDLRPLWQELRNEMRDVVPELPAETLGPFVNDRFGDVAALIVVLQGAGPSMADLHQAARDVRARLYTVPGIQRIELHGVRPERLFLEASRARLAMRGPDPRQWIAELRDRNAVLPGGQVSPGGLQIEVEPAGGFESAQEIGALALPAEDGGFVYLRDVFDLRRGYEEPPRSLLLADGEPAVALAVSMADGANVLDFSPAVRARLKTLQERLPLGYRLAVAFDQAEHVRRSIDEVAINLLQTMGIVLVVAMLFLDWRSGLIVGLHVPLTVVLSLLAMHALGIPLHRASLGTMIIALGILVDSAVVVVEQIRSRRDSGEAPAEAARATGREFAVPLLTSSATTVLAFAPLALSEHVSAEYLRSMPVVILLTLAFSWLLAMTVTPLLARRLVGGESRARGGRRRATGWYRSLLGRALRHPWPVLAAALALVGVGGLLLAQLPRQFFPLSDRNQVLVYVDLPAGHDVPATRDAIRPFLAWLDDRDANPQVERHLAYVGYGGPRFFLSLTPRDPAPETATVVVDLAPDASPAAVARSLRRHLEDHAPGLRARVRQFSLGPTQVGLMEARLTGVDAATLLDWGRRVAARLRALPSVMEVHNDWRNRVYRYRVSIDQERARAAGVTAREVAQSLAAELDGVTVTALRDGETLVPIVLRGTRDGHDDPRQLQAAYVYGSAGAVPLLQVARIEPRADYAAIGRRNLARTLTVSARHADKSASELEQMLVPALEADLRSLPPGYGYSFGGETEKSREARAALYRYLPHALVVIVLLLLWQFDSYRKVTVVLTTIPLAFVGGIAVLPALDLRFGFMAVLGLLSLTGIIVNIAIVMVDKIQRETAGAADPAAALVEAAAQRLRPVMMTTVTTILGLTPLILPPDPLYYATAVVIAAGLALGTGLALIVTPLGYAAAFSIRPPRRP